MPITLVLALFFFPPYLSNVYLFIDSRWKENKTTLIVRLRNNNTNNNGKRKRWKESVLCVTALEREKKKKHKNRKQ